MVCARTLVYDRRLNALRAISFLDTVWANKNKVITGNVGTIFIVASLIITVNTFTNILGVFAKYYAHSAVKDIKRAFPIAFIAKLFAVFNNTAI